MRPSRFAGAQHCPAFHELPYLRTAPTSNRGQLQREALQAIARVNDTLARAPAGEHKYELTLLGLARPPTTVVGLARQRVAGVEPAMEEEHERYRCARRQRVRHVNTNLRSQAFAQVLLMHDQTQGKHIWSPESKTHPKACPDAPRVGSRVAL